MKNKLVSIIIRTKDRPNLLQRAIDSVYSQTYPNIEIVIVNDSGCDVSKIVNHYKNLKPDKGLVRKIEHIVNKTSLYRPGAGNVGIKAAQGKYIGFLDDDDYYFANHVEEHVKAQTKKKSPVSISIGTEAIEKIVKKSAQRQRRVFRYPREINKISLLFFENYFPFNTIMFQKEITKKIGFLDEKRFVLEDWDFIIRIFLNYKPAFVENVTCEFTTRYDVTNIRNNFEYKKVWRDNFLAIIDKYKKVYKKSEVAIPISEISDFLSYHSKEWYETSIQWDMYRDSFAFKLFYSKFYFRLKKIARIFKLTRG